MPSIPISEVRRRYERGISRGLDEVADAFVDEATRIIEEEAVDEGTLKNSVETRKPSPRVREVAWTAHHAVFVHYGTRPHWPPLAPILAWVKRNLRRFTNTAGVKVDVIRPIGKAAERARPSPDSVALDVARAVQAKIAKEGTAPVPWVPRALARVRPKMQGLLSKAVDEEMQ